jgi:hypothetical protein
MKGSEINKNNINENAMHMVVALDRSIYTCTAQTFHCSVSIVIFVRPLKGTGIFF